MNRGEESELRRYLEPGERTLWAGAPRQGLVLRGADAFMIPFSLLWGGFAIFWEATALTQGAPMFVALWGVPFVLVGLYLIVGRFFVDARVRANTVYGLTEQRVIILSGLFSRSVTTLPLRTLHHISLEERADRTGTVLLGQPQPFSGMYRGMQWPGGSRLQVPALDMIPDAKRVHDQVLEAQKAASGA